MSFLGLDVGSKRIGVARSDELNFMAHSAGFIERTDDHQVIQKLKELVDEFQVEKMIVGLPTMMSGRSGTQAEKVLAFVQLVKGYLTCPIVTWDERLTTVQAERAMLAQDMSRAKRKKKRDAIAAEIMLQSYLDCVKHRGNETDV